jgi:hypothetical protein
VELRAPAAPRELAPRVVKTPDGNETWIVRRDTALSPPGCGVLSGNAARMYGVDPNL